jgi:hypothetical protein
MALTTKYITPTDYLNYYGINLNAILPDDDMPSGKAERFIMQVEDEVAMMLESRCFKRIDVEWANFSEYQKECYKKALLSQCYYKIKNGDLANESGYDVYNGKNISQNELKEIELSRQCIRYLNLCGLWNRNISGKLGGGMFFPFIR